MLELSWLQITKAQFRLVNQKKKYIDTYNQTAKKSQMQMVSGTTEIVTLLENSFHLSSLCLTSCHFYSFKLAYSCQQGPWHRQLWIHIFARFTASGAKESSEPKLFEKLGKALTGLPWVIWLMVNQLVWTDIGNYYWSSLSHMPTVVAKRGILGLLAIIRTRLRREKWFSKIMDFLF